VFRIRLNADTDPDPGFATIQEQFFLLPMLGIRIRIRNGSVCFWASRIFP
jgi:hypothetical protein